MLNKNLTNMKHSQSGKTQKIFLAIFVVLSVCLGLTLYLYYKVNSGYEDELNLMKDIHHLKAKLLSLHPNHRFKGYLEINEVFEGINVIGKVEGLQAGSQHAVHILEYSDISQLEESKVGEEYLKHFNPTNSPHSCPSNGNKGEEDYHFGDLGNIIANNEGIGFISIIRNLPIRSLNGRLVVITKTMDKCESGQEVDKINDILGYGTLSAYKPIVNPHANYNQDYFMREINTVNKKEFEKKNKLVKEKEVPKQHENVKAAEEKKRIENSNNKSSEEKKESKIEVISHGEDKTITNKPNRTEHEKKEPKVDIFSDTIVVPKIIPHIASKKEKPSLFGEDKKESEIQSNKEPLNIHRRHSSRPFYEQRQIPLRSGEKDLEAAPLFFSPHMKQDTNNHISNNIHLFPNELKDNNISHKTEGSFRHINRIDEKPKSNLISDSSFSYNPFAHMKIENPSAINLNHKIPLVGESQHSSPLSDTSTNNKKKLEEKDLEKMSSLLDALIDEEKLDEQKEKKPIPSSNNSFKKKPQVIIDNKEDSKKNMDNFGELPFSLGSFNTNNKPEPVSFIQSSKSENVLFNILNI
jgi:Cu/Zn superoxide dismutase